MNHPAISNYTADIASRQNLVKQSYQRKNGDAITEELRVVINSLLDNQFRHDLYRMKHHIAPGYLMERLQLLESYGCDVFAMRYQEVNGVKPRVEWDGPGCLEEFAWWINVKECHRNFSYEEWLKLRGWGRRPE